MSRIRAAHFLFFDIALLKTAKENTDNTRWNRLRLRRSEMLIVGAFRFFRAHGVEPILIKGWAAARFYPDDNPRFFGDTDLAVSAAAYDRAVELLHTPEGSTLGVDLHREMRHLDGLSWDALFARSELVDLDGVPVRILCAEDHLRVLCVHWLNDGGQYKERLWDIYYAVARRPPEFDWEKCLDCVSETRRGWVITTIGLAHRYLDLPIDGLPFADDARKIPEWVINCVEKEWKSEVRLRPLQVFIYRPLRLLEQIKKRIPPNPIQATIDMEGKFDNRTRVFYQIGSILKRIGPSIRRNAARILTGRVVR